jgi:hypothetical protein
MVVRTQFVGDDAASVRIPETDAPTTIQAAMSLVLRDRAMAFLLPQ